MLKPTVYQALNDQMNAEFYSAHLYLSMAGYCQSKNLKGFANWFQVQVQEETFHAMKFFTFILERGQAPVLEGMEKPQSTWESPLAVFESTQVHEQYVTDRIHKLMDIALKESDHATANVLQWYVGEQVEEEANVDGLLQQLRMVKDNASALFMIDRELATRVFISPATPA
jgi:ferritin